MNCMNNHERRLSERLPVEFQVEANLDNGEVFTCRTRNVSDTGTYLYHDDQFQLSIGDRLSIRVINVPGEPPWNTMKVVRLEENGFGLIFDNNH